MRITCPNCSAQYEIDASLLPDEGREVQCSACSHVWFQASPRAAPPAPPPPPIVPEPGTTTKVEIDTDAAETDQSPAVSQVAPQPAPKPVDEKVLGILREEAAFEAEARARDAERLESQPELGLQGSAPWPRTPGTEPEPETVPVEPRKGGRDPVVQAAFPDIEDISATLEPIQSKRKTDEGQIDLPATAQERNRSFLRGLVIPIALGIILIALYIAAPQLSASLPALEPALTSYVGLVDGLRMSLAEMIGR